MLGHNLDVSGRSSGGASPVIFGKTGQHAEQLRSQWSKAIDDDHWTWAFHTLPFGFGVRSLTKTVNRIDTQGIVKWGSEDWRVTKPLQLLARSTPTGAPSGSQTT